MARKPVKAKAAPKKRGTATTGAGRPTKYDPKFCDEIIELGRTGHEVAEIALHFNVSKQTLYDWQDAHPAFLDAFTRARDFAEAHHAKELRTGIRMGAGEFQGGSYLKYMSLRFRRGPDGGWAESQDVNLNGTLDVNGARDGLADQLAKAAAAIAAAAGVAAGAAEPK